MAGTRERARAFLPLFVSLELPPTSHGDPLPVRPHRGRRAARRGESRGPVRIPAPVQVPRLDPLRSACRPSLTH